MVETLEWLFKEVKKINRRDRLAVVCIKREWEWKSIGLDNKFSSGMRFMDDVLILFYYNTNQQETETEAHRRKELFKKDCYFKQWNLKESNENIFLSTEYKWVFGQI